MAGRKILWFLGAGASKGAGAVATVQAGGELEIPTQRNFWEVFLRFSKGRANRKTIESFLFRYFLGQKVPSRLTVGSRRKKLNNIDVEEVFTFLSERARAPATSPSLRTYVQKVWIALVSEIGNVFCRFPPNSRTRSVFRGLLKKQIGKKDAVVSFNYDTVFESSLPHYYDWGYASVESTVGALRILKPHGSVNWEYDSDDHRISVADNPDISVIVAPTHLKFIRVANTDEDSIDVQEEGTSSVGYLDQAQEIREIWEEMERQMKRAKALVFIGYSFPVADLYFSSVLRSVLADRDSNPGIVIVNPDAVEIARRLKARFAIDEPILHYDIKTFAGMTRRELLAQVEDRS